MRSSTFGLAPAAWLLLFLDTVSAVPNAPVPKLLPRQSQSAANPTDLWVTVDESGRPKTVTPVLTTINGTPTIISGAPYQVTGTVFTQTRADVKITTSTGAEQPKATGSNGGGSFALCRNRDGDHAPFCEPKNNATIYPGATHYVTWDPSFFNTTNTTVRVVGFYNETEEAFSSDLIAAGWGFYQWAVKSELYSSKHQPGVNITFRLAALPVGKSVQWVPGPTVLVTSSPTPVQEPSKPPSGEALYIAIPTVLGFVALMVFGTCIWNRKARRIELGNIMGRGRGGYGVGKSRRQRMFGKGARKDRILLTEQEGGQVYRDEPQQRGGDDDDWKREVPGGADGLPRRDSDALGSLAGTPTQDRHFDFSSPGLRRN